MLIRHTYLIVCFKLEENYPSLAKLIKIRRKFQGYSIWLHISFVIIMLFYFIFVIGFYKVFP